MEYCDGSAFPWVKNKIKSIPKNLERSRSDEVFEVFDAESPFRIVRSYMHRDPGNRQISDSGCSIGRHAFICTVLHDHPFLENSPKFGDLSDLALAITVWCSTDRRQHIGHFHLRRLSPPISEMSSSALRLSVLDPPRRAAFATISRLLCALVTESLVSALYFPLEGFEATGVAIILNGEVSSQTPAKDSYSPADILAIAPLLHVPVFKHDSASKRGTEIALLDPFDLMPLVLEVQAGVEGDGKMSEVRQLDLLSHVVY